MKLLDTNILIYAVGRPHVYKEPCARLVNRIGGGEIGYNIDAELLQEILHVYISRGERQRGLTMFDDLVRLFPDLLSITKGDVVVARQLIERYPSLSPRDAVHAAVVLTNGLEDLVSTDSVFDEMVEVVRFDPKEL